MTLRILAGIGVPVWVFVCVALMNAAARVDFRGDQWWRFPLAVTLFLAVVAMLVVGSVGLGGFAIVGAGR